MATVQQSRSAPVERPAGERPAGRVITVTERAAARIAQLIAGDGSAGPRPAFRIQVEGGGCSGFHYDFALDRNRAADDTVFAVGGSEVVVDESSLGLLAGSELDWIETLAGASFKLSNPNAASSCGCGHSFSV